MCEVAATRIHALQPHLNGIGQFCPCDAQIGADHHHLTQSRLLRQKTQSGNRDQVEHLNRWHAVTVAELLENAIEAVGRGGRR